MTCGCSLQKLAVNSLADTLSSGAIVYLRDDDPALVKDALPFALKTYEMLLETSPDNEELLLTTCQGFTLYTYGFVAADLLRLELEDYRRYKVEKTRAKKLFLRAREYCLRALEQRDPEIRRALVRAPEETVRAFRRDDVELLFWTGSSWGSAISQGADEPGLVADLPVVRALLSRALELEPNYESGLLYEAMMTLDSLPEAMGGSLERAREHYEKALELSQGQRPSTYVSWAELFSYSQQNRQEFEELLKKALEIDPDARRDQRLATLISQERARTLLDLVDDLFL